MGRAINNENAIDRLEIEVAKLKGDMEELQDVVAELSQSLVSTKQVHHLDDEEFTPPAGKRKRAKVEKSNAEA